MVVLMVGWGDVFFFSSPVPLGIKPEGRQGGVRSKGDKRVKGRRSRTLHVINEGEMSVGWGGDELDPPRLED